MSVSLLILGFGLAAAALAAQKPAVRVEFRIDKGTGYLRGFDSVEQRRLTDSITAMLRAALTEHLGFLTYGEDPRAPYALVVKLARNDTVSQGGAFEVGFYAALVEPSGHTTSLYLKMYRSVDAFGVGPGTEGAFRLAMALKLGELRDADWTTLVSRLFSRIPITDSAVVWRQPLGWILPRRHGDLCLGEESRLDVNNQVRQGVVSRPRTVPVQAARFDPPPGAAPELELMRNRIFGIADDSVHLQFDTLKVTGIFVREYRFDAGLCPRLTKPGDANFSGDHE